MAALLCESFGKLCSGCSHAMCLPCRACCEGIGQAITSPFFPYIAVTLALNVPPTVFGIQSIAGQSCPATWLWVNAALCAIHIIACFYIAHKVQEDSAEIQLAAQPAVVTGTAVTGMAVDSSSSTKKVEEGKATSSTPLVVEPNQPTAFAQPFVIPRDDNATAASSFRRLKQVLCYDPGFALYILVFVFWMFWQTAGLKEALSFQDNDDCGQLGRWVVYSIMCGFLYMMMVCAAFACSLLCLR